MIGIHPETNSGSQQTDVAVMVVRASVGGQRGAPNE